MNLQEIIEMNSPSWNYVINKFTKSNFSSPYVDYSTPNNSSEPLDILREILSILLIHIAYASHVKDKFPNPYCYQIPHYPSANLKSEKMKSEFTLGIYQNNYYLTAAIHYPFYLKSMDDNFWGVFVELSEFGKFEFKENIVPSSEKAKHIEKTLGKCKSNVFNLIKNYILLEEGGGSGDIGSLEISWPVTIEINDLINNAIKAFTNLHKVNYLLYRRYYINNKRK
jgi:hypothetical protein